MFKKLAKNRFFWSIAILFGLFLIAVLVAQLKAKDAVSDFLERKLPQHVQLKYGDIDVNVLSGTIALQDIELDFYDRDSMLLNTAVIMDAISLEDLGYWDFLVNEKIDVSRLLLEKPQVRHYPYRVLSSEDAEPKGVVQLLKVIDVGELAVQNGRLHLLQQSNDSVLLAIGDFNFSVTDVITGPERITKKIPVDYREYELKADSLYVNLGDYEELNAASVYWNPAGAKVNGLGLRSKYDKAKLSQRLTAERDHIELDIPKMELDSIRFGFKKDTFFIATGMGTIHRPALEMYRDKLIADDATTKDLYSRSIRQLPIHLDVPKIKIVDGNVVYSERVADVENPGKLSFENLNATLANISNTYPSGEKTKIEAETEFMGYAKMTLDWSFDTNDRNDAFLAKGTVFNFDTESINPFLVSNLRAKASGTIDELYFTISGNTSTSSGDMKMKYDDFKFQVLKKNRLGINKLLTAVGNIFVNSGETTDAEGYRYGDIEVERDPTKSFFSYLWMNVRDGTVSTLTGDGKKGD
ncbi:MAG: hypothetical protein WA913_04860 [Pricia sp.]